MSTNQKQLFLSKLAPCPICGSIRTSILTDKEYDPYNYHFKPYKNHILCGDCGLHIYERNNLISIRKWNKE